MSHGDTESATSTTPIPSAAGSPDPALPGPPAARRLVNLGCGGRFHPDWMNLDLHPAAPGVIRADFVRGIPLPDRSAAGVYHSHVLEHLSPDQAEPFLRDCLRVLVPGGRVRVVVPDLERIARDYVAALDARRSVPEPADCESPEDKRLRWVRIELLDQMVRTRQGGQMARAFAEVARDPEFRAFVAPRLGTEGDRQLDAAADAEARGGGGPGRLERTQAALERRFGNLGRSIGVGLLRARGEHHQWMYDEFALADLLRHCGFDRVRRHAAHTSDLPGFADAGLDVQPDGTPYKAISLYLEGARPSTATGGETGDAGARA